MKILLATFFGLPAIGGLNTYVTILKKELEKNGHIVDVLAQHPDFRKVYIIDTNRVIEKWNIRKSIELYVNNFYEQHYPNATKWIRMREIQRYVYEIAASSMNLEQYDIIHAQDIISARALSRVKLDHVPLVTTIHGAYTKELLNNRYISSKESDDWYLMNSFEEIAMESVDKLIFLTNWMQNSVNVSKDSIIIPTGIDITHFTEEMKKSPNPNIRSNRNKFIISCPARLVHEKDHRTLINAIERLRIKRKDFIVWLIGDGPLRQELELTIKRRKLEKYFLFLGNRSDVPALLKRSDLVVLPSMQENLPITIMEAQVAGKPIIASNVGGIPEMIIHRKNGLLFNKQNSVQLYKQLEYLMINKGLRNYLGDNAKKWGIKHWSSNVFYKQIMDTYDSAIKDYGYSKEQEVNIEDINMLNNKELIIFDDIKQYSLPDGYTIPDPKLTEKLNRILNLKN